MSNDLSDFEQFMKQRQASSLAYVQGDAAPLGKMVTHTSPATFFSAQGGHREGADEVWATYEHDAGAFTSRSDNSLEILHMDASDGLGYWVGFQRSTAYMQGQTEPIEFNLRVTELFRRENGEWKMIHRHADLLVSKKKPG